jgi:hypothetical protein
MPHERIQFLAKFSFEAAKNLYPVKILKTKGFNPVFQRGNY